MKIITAIQAPELDFFLRPDTALLPGSEPFYLPDFLGRISAEAQLVVRISRAGKAIAEQFAGRYYDAIGLGVSFIAEELLQTCRAQGSAWSRAVAFDHSAAVGPFIPLSDLSDLSELPPRGELHYTLTVNDLLRQEGDYTADFRSDIDRFIAHVSRSVTLRVGDLLFISPPTSLGGGGSVTPRAENTVKIGDRLVGSLADRTLLDIEVK